MRVTIANQDPTPVRAANIAAGDCFINPDQRNRVFQVLYHSMSGPSICLCFRPDRPPERVELDPATPALAAHFTSAEFSRS